MSREDIAQALKISGEENLEALRRRLRAMERDGQLVLLDVSVMPYLNASIFGKVKLSVTVTAMVFYVRKAKRMISIFHKMK